MVRAWCLSATISRCSAARERTKNRSEQGSDDGHDDWSLIGMASNLKSQGVPHFW
jgi:hypothetical protein